MKMKPASNSPSQTLTSAAATSSQDTRLLVRETLRISANLASAPPSTGQEIGGLRSGNASYGLVEERFVDSSSSLVCYEEIDGRRWKYLAQNSDFKQFKKGSIRAVSLQNPQTPVDFGSKFKCGFATGRLAPLLFHQFSYCLILQSCGSGLELVSFIRSYVVPEGFPDSVTPSYVPYMTWRALKHFFGGAMGVFTTQTLLNSVGVSRNQAVPGAVAINWILKILVWLIILTSGYVIEFLVDKTSDGNQFFGALAFLLIVGDGAGRVGKMLFARQGRKFDYDLKQLRFAGDLLMELGAGVELATAAVPHLFLPLACAANVAKNVAAVTSTSTRTPIYKAFAKGENIGDVTAKGECVGNVADLVKSVVLHTLNRARFTVAVETFLKTGRVPTLQEGNVMETVFNFPWSKDRPIVLGSRFKDAFQDVNSYLAVEPVFEKERYVVTYNPSKGNIYALLKDQAKPDDILKAAFHAHVLLHVIRSSNDNQSSMRQSENNHSIVLSPSANFSAHLAESYKMVSAFFAPFKSKAKEQGWVMSESHLNPGRARLCELGK
ncbi:hypothetical protein LguiB_021737 [Lonicera macranthoides]